MDRFRALSIPLPGFVLSAAVSNCSPHSGPFQGRQTICQANRRAPPPALAEQAGGRGWNKCPRQRARNKNARATPPSQASAQVRAVPGVRMWGRSGYASGGFTAAFLLFGLRPRRFVMSQPVSSYDHRVISVMVSDSVLLLGRYSAFFTGRSGVEHTTNSIRSYPHHRRWRGSSGV